jgi:hypothetical protein
MAFTIVFDQGATPIPGFDMVAMGTVTADNSSDPTGEVVDMSAQFSTVDGVSNEGISAVALAGYNLIWICAKGAAAATGVKVVATFVDTDGSYGKEGVLVPATADLSALGTFRVKVTGKAA